VFDEEPATADPLVANDAVLATPHLGYVTWDTYEAHFSRAFAQVAAFAAGAPIDVANPEALAAGTGGAGTDGTNPT
jgi:D-3-phosphoglycerate dehydrogenase / 2-oxoglutarate reductase